MLPLIAEILLAHPLRLSPLTTYFPVTKDIVERGKNEGQEVLVVNGKSSSSFFGGCTSTSSYNPCRRRVTSRSTTPYVFGSNLEAAQASRDENDSAADRSFAGTVLENTMTLCQPIHFAAQVVVKNPKYVLQRWQGECS